MDTDRIVHIVDDDVAVRRSLERLLRSANYAVVLYESALLFIAAAPRLSAGCVLLDARMPGIDGLQVQARLNRLGVTPPVIVMAGHGDVHTAVQAMKGGAVDCIEKPFDDALLLAAIEAALADMRRVSQAREAADASTRVATLSTRESQVLRGLVAGCPNKVIAHDLGISVRTVELHRSRMLGRLGVHSVGEAVRLAVIVDRTSPSWNSERSAASRSWNCSAPLADDLRHNAV